MAKMTIMQGLPASGKSTKAKELLTVGNTVRINKDLLRTMLHFDNFTGRNEGQTKDAARALAEMFLKQDVNVIIDDTNLNEGTVQSWKDLARAADAKIEYVEMLTSVEECIERDYGREKRVGKTVIQKMALQYRNYLKGENVVICDLDGTLCDIQHRRHFVEKEPKDWKSFFNRLVLDTLRTDVWDKVQKSLSEHKAKLILVSARPDNYYPFTRDWLVDKIGEENFDILIMRQANDKRPDTEVKSDMYDKYLKGLKIVKVFDDRPRVIQMWREKGLDVDDVGNGIDF